LKDGTDKLLPRIYFDAFAAATDHRFLDIGHVLDFTNKALARKSILMQTARVKAANYSSRQRQVHIL
jgi:hypothetical protein